MNTLLATVVLLAMLAAPWFGKDSKPTPKPTPAPAQPEQAQQPQVGDVLKFSPLEQVALDDYAEREKNWYSRKQQWLSQQQQYQQQFNTEQNLLLQQRQTLNKAFLDARHLSDKELHYNFETGRLEKVPPPAASTPKPAEKK